MIDRYARQTVLPQLGADGQQKLREGSVLIVGAGGLGSPVALYLAAAGVGRIGLVDFDRVELTNLHRQIVFSELDLHRPKVDAAREQLERRNHEIVVEPHAIRMDRTNALELIEKYDLVVDASDNFATRYLINDACISTGRPNVHGSIFRFEGQASIFIPRVTACYRCIHPSPPSPGSVPNCEESGVVGSIAGIIGSIQATEAIKQLAGIPSGLRGRLLMLDAERMDFRSFRIERRDDCPSCGDARTIRALIDYDAFCGALMHEIKQMTPMELDERLRAGDELQIVDVREQNEWDAGHLDQARLLPLSKWPSIASELDASRETVVICRSGGRSMRAAQALAASGFANVWNLAGGMRRWSAEVDPNLRVV